MNKHLKIEYTTKKGEKLYSEPGNNGPKDKRLYIGYKDSLWCHTLELIGAALRAKAYIEDWNYLPNGGEGRGMLFKFIKDCIFTKIPIRDLLKKYKIPERK